MYSSSHLKPEMLPYSALPKLMPAISKGTSSLTSMYTEVKVAAYQPSCISSETVYSPGSRSSNK